MAKAMPDEEDRSGEAAAASTPDAFMKIAGKGVLLFFLAVLILGLDIAVKTYVFQTLHPFQEIPIFKDFFGIDFSIRYVKNQGAAWGLFSSYHHLLLIFRIGLILGLILYLIFWNRNKGLEIPFSLIIAGAIGNVLDSFFYGHVVDMFHFVLWGFDFAVFNVADAAVTIGVLWILLFGSQEKKSTGWLN